MGSTQSTWEGAGGTALVPGLQFPLGNNANAYSEGSLGGEGDIADGTVIDLSPNTAFAVGGLPDLAFSYVGAAGGADGGISYVTVIPEPSTMIMLAMGGLALVW